MPGLFAKPCILTGDLLSAAADAAAAELEDEVDDAPLLDEVVREEATLLQLGAITCRQDGVEEQPILVLGDPCLLIDHGLHLLDSDRRLHLEGVGLARDGLDEDLYFEAGGGVEMWWSMTGFLSHLFVMTGF